MAAQERAIGQDDMMAEAAVMAHVAVHHQEITGADDGFLGAFVGAMDGDVLTKDIVIAEAQAGAFSFVFQVLRRIANHAAGVKTVVGSNHGVAGEVDLGAEFAMSPKDYLSVNHTIRPDAGAGIDLGFGMDQSGGMNHGSRIKVAQFPERSVILRALLRFAAQDDMIQHINFQQLSGPNQIPCDFDVGFGWGRIAAGVVMHQDDGRALAVMAARNTSRGCTRMVSMVPCEILSIRINLRRVLSSTTWNCSTP